MSYVHGEQGSDRCSLDGSCREYHRERRLLGDCLPLQKWINKNLMHLNICARRTVSPKGRGQHEEYFLPYEPIVQLNVHYLEFIQTHMYIRALWLLSCPSLTTLVLTFT
jgi:hypothetical protein